PPAAAGARLAGRGPARASPPPPARLIVEQRPGPGDLIRLRADGERIAFDVHRVREPQRPAPGVRDSAPAPGEKLPRVAALARELAERVRAEAEAPPALPVS